MSWKKLMKAQVLSVLAASIYCSLLAAQEVPAFYKSTCEDVYRALESVKKGVVRLETFSAGQRPVYSVSYGVKDNFERTANFESAALSHHPEAFARRAPGAKPVLLVLAGVHGHEVEGLVGALNLINILETGKDLRGKAWPEIVEKASKYRLVIMPLVNPDGRARVPKNSFVGLPADTMTFYGQGSRVDGSMYRWPFVKGFHPMLKDVGFLGGYFNDQGVNVQCDDMFEPMARETRAVLNLARNEAPDCVVNVHSHEERGEFLVEDWTPQVMRERNKAIADRYLAVMTAEGTPPCSFKRELTEPTWALDLTGALYHVSGALSMTYEGPHGVTGDSTWAIGHEGILDSHLIMYRELLRIGLEPGGFRGEPGTQRGNWQRKE